MNANNRLIAMVHLLVSSLPTDHPSAIAARELIESIKIEEVR